MRCCLCSNPDAPHIERRFTDRNGKQLQLFGLSASFDYAFLYSWS